MTANESRSMLSVRMQVHRYTLNPHIASESVVAPRCALNYGCVETLEDVRMPLHSGGLLGR